MSAEGACQELAFKAAMAFYEGRHRDAADMYLEAIKSAPSKWETNKWNMVRGYTSILREGYFTASPSDLSALKDMADDKSEVKLFRCEAAFSLGLILWDSNYRDQAADMYRECIRVGNKAKGRERTEKVVAMLSSGVGEKPFGELIDEIVKDATFNLEQLEKPNMNMDKKEIPSTFLRSDGTTAPNTVKSSFVDIGPRAASLTKEQIARLVTVGGKHCDGCEKTREELGLKRLNICKQCTRAYYCSRPCQVTAWKAGHRECCRKLGEFKAGDYVKLTGITTEPQINGQIVEIIKPHKTQGGAWKVRIPGGEKSIWVATEKMEQLRPLK
jgi:hypothetical protein